MRLPPICEAFTKRVVPTNHVLFDPIARGRVPMRFVNDTRVPGHLNLVGLVELPASLASPAGFRFSCADRLDDECLTPISTAVPCFKTCNRLLRSRSSVFIRN